MPIIKQSENTFEPVPAGTHPARCCSMVSIGTHVSKNPQFKPAFQVVLQFEFPGETININGEEKPMVTTKFLSAYLGSVSKPSKANEFLTAWRGKQFTDKELQGFDLSKVVGAPCLIGITHVTKDGKLRENISSISPLPKGMTVPPMVNKQVIYEITQGRDAVFQALPEWLQKIIASCQEWTAPIEEAPAANQPSDNDGDNVDPEVGF